LSNILRKDLSEFGLTNKNICFVKDGGSNLKTCADALRGIVSCDSLNQSSGFEGLCIAHIISGACNASIAPVLYQSLEHNKFIRKVAKLRLLDLSFGKYRGQIFGGLSKI
jgi:hypothetical protein